MIDSRSQIPPLPDAAHRSGRNDNEIFCYFESRDAPYVITSETKPCDVISNAGYVPNGISSESKPRHVILSESKPRHVISSETRPHYVISSEAKRSREIWLSCDNNCTSRTQRWRRMQGPVAIRIGIIRFNPGILRPELGLLKSFGEALANYS